MDFFGPKICIKSVMSQKLPIFPTVHLQIVVERHCEKTFDGFWPYVRLAAMVLKDIKLPVNLPIKREQMVFETAAAIT